MCNEKVLFCNQSTQGYSQATMVPPDKLCNGFTVKNAGNTICIVNGEPIQPDDFKTFGMNRGEIYIGRIDLSFVLPTPAPPIPTNQAFVTQKFYVNMGPKSASPPDLTDYIAQ